MAIPKIIHYCWFGGTEKPKLAQKCIKSWKKHCKKYQIIEWNENNFDVWSAPKFVQDAYKAKKWAFVTDYVRLKVVYDYGGVYLDTDVELLKNLDKFLQYPAFFGLEYDLYIASGLGFGAERKSKILKELFSVYDTLSYIQKADEQYRIACPVLNEPIFFEYGFKKFNQLQVLIDGTRIFPREFFCPIDLYYNKNFTKNTVSIHHFSASWAPEAQAKVAEYKRIKKIEKRKKIKRYFSIKWWIFKILGEKNFNKLKKVFKRK